MASICIEPKSNLFLTGRCTIHSFKNFDDLLPLRRLFCKLRNSIRLRPGFYQIPGKSYISYKTKIGTNIFASSSELPPPL